MGNVEARLAAIENVLRALIAASVRDLGMGYAELLMSELAHAEQEKQE